MLPLPPFDLHHPASLPEAMSLLSRLGPGAMVIAGGTDVLPGLKQGIIEAPHLVSLARVADLRGVSEAPTSLRIGAMTSLAEVASHPAVRAGAPGLAEAAGGVGGPHHRRMGTLGGNLCLDTRCRYYNQTHFWRSALGYCLKKDGTVCHVVRGGQKCVAAASNDTAAAAITLEGSLRILGPSGERVVLASEFYTADGLKNTTLAPGEIVTALEIPVRAGRRSAYEKLRRRGAIDFPMLSVAVRLDVADGAITALEVVVSALAARPRAVAAVRTLAIGVSPQSLDVGAIARAARKECTPLANIDGDPAWRREMVPVLVERAVRRALASRTQPA